MIHFESGYKKRGGGFKLPRLHALHIYDFELRATHKPAHSTGFCVIWVCISSSSSVDHREALGSGCETAKALGLRVTESSGAVRVGGFRVTQLHMHIAHYTCTLHPYTRDQIRGGGSNSSSSFSHTANGNPHPAARSVAAPASTTQKIKHRWDGGLVVGCYVT